MVAEAELFRCRLTTDSVPHFRTTICPRYRTGFAPERLSARAESRRSRIREVFPPIFAK
jgi:hypothetical protein